MGIAEIGSIVIGFFSFVFCIWLGWIFINERLNKR